MIYIIAWLIPIAFAAGYSLCYWDNRYTIRVHRKASYEAMKAQRDFMNKLPKSDHVGLAALPPQPQPKPAKGIAAKAPQSTRKGGTDNEETSKPFSGLDENGTNVS